VARVRPYGRMARHALVQAHSLYCICIISILIEFKIYFKISYFSKKEEEEDDDDDISRHMLKPETSFLLNLSFCCFSIE